MRGLRTDLGRFFARIVDRVVGSLAALVPGMRLRPRDRGEACALRSLVARGWTPVAVNSRVGHDEADLLLLDDADRPVLVEVKSTAGGGRVELAELVGADKAARLVRIARTLGSDERFAGRVPRIDVVLVALGATATSDRVELHLEDAIDVARLRPPGDRSRGSRGPRQRGRAGPRRLDR
jgi:Holliday junction resolvase-like predicted endonuclease